MNEELVCMADIQNKIYEAGLFRPEEKVVLATKGCVLLEYFTGKTYSYRMVDLNTLKAKRLFSRQKPLTQEGYQRAIEKMLTRAPEPESTARSDGRKRSRELLAYIFSDILPKHGMVLRDNQLSLSMSMLDALWESKLALCEAEVGTGKTHAYILAAIVYRLFQGSMRPTVISTSTIALQKALTEEYIPQISGILLEHRIINRPLTYAVRKGKSHYACDDRVRNYLSSIRHNNRPEDSGLLAALTALSTGACPIDLDGLELTDYVKGRICVSHCHFHCDLSAVCRYRDFLRRTQTMAYDFQIANHNLVLADILSQKGGRNRLLPQSGILIFDEAHKLLDAARQMYGMAFENTELEQLVSSAYRVVGMVSNRKEAALLCGELLRLNGLLFETIRHEAGAHYDKSCQAFDFTPVSIRILNTLAATLNGLSVCFYHPKAGGAQKRLLNRIEQEQAKLMLLKDNTESICWLERTGVSACRLCTLPKALDFLLYEDIWNQGTPCVLTSGTLSIGGDFSHFMHQTGIDLLEQHRLLMTSKASPFDYENHALLYLPEDMPFPDTKNSAYMAAVLEQLTELIRQSHGHTLVLFTSYRMMEIVYQELSKPQAVDYPLFCMSKGRLDTITAFRKSGNGVLLASDSAGEGIDLAGDILSSLIVVRLPFPTPDPVSEYERTLHDDFYSYLSESIIPSMLIKLRQWIGRGIRRETDTCVFSILDSRAAGRYKKDILAALPDMPVTDRIDDVGRFILEKKSDAYFQ
ncbi:ATP-dependent DNA helicase [Enterocloster sp. OA13]|uniref:ATP-dependent DNA helicase n=1 Tax=Enterocloster sp. OA13 TaxID=2914161 RepID=UPI00047192A1|nr:ATP-dependent DNA helicase [Enterocloster sp. OA13]